MSTVVRSLVWLTAMVTAAGAVAAPSGDFGACRPLADAAARLACYDAVADGLVAHKAEAPTQSFGLPAETVLKQVLPAAAPVDEIRAHVRAVRGGQSGRLVFDLDNGQVWEQLMATPDALVEAGQAVTVRSGALGSFQMTTASGRTYKVRRLR